MIALGRSVNVVVVRRRTASGVLRQGSESRTRVGVIHSSETGTPGWQTVNIYIGCSRRFSVVK